METMPIFKMLPPQWRLPQKDIATENAASEEATPADGAKLKRKVRSNEVSLGRVPMIEAPAMLFMGIYYTHTVTFHLRTYDP